MGATAGLPFRALLCPQTPIVVAVPSGKARRQWIWRLATTARGWPAMTPRRDPMPESAMMLDSTRWSCKLASKRWASAAAERKSSALLTTVRRSRSGEPPSHVARRRMSSTHWLVSHRRWGQRRGWRPAWHPSPWWWTGWTRQRRAGWSGTSHATLGARGGDGCRRCGLHEMEGAAHSVTR